MALLGALRADGLRLVRDRFLLGTAAYVLGVSVAMRWALPALATGLKARWGFDLTPGLPLWVSYFALVLSGILVAFIGGFLLLEAREDRTVKAVLVSPLSLSVYVGTVCAVMALGAASLALVQAAVIGLALPPPGALGAAAVVGGASAPWMALALAAGADNKVEAFALSKFVSLAGLVPLAAGFLPEPWQWLATPVPAYWACKVYWLAQSGAPAASWLPWAGGGLALALAATTAAARAYTTAARRRP